MCGPARFLFATALLCAAALALGACDSAAGGDTTDTWRADTGWDGGALPDVALPDAGDLVGTPDAQVPDAADLWRPPDAAPDIPTDTSIVPCTPAPTLPFFFALEVDGTPWGGYEGFDCYPGCSLDGAAWVVERSEPTADPDAERSVLLRFDDEVATELLISYRFPGAWEIPLAVGERVDVAAWMESPWWINQSLRLSYYGTDLLFDFYSGTWSGNLVEVSCGPWQDDCGLVEYGSASFTLGPDGPSIVLGSGEMAAIVTEDGRYRAMMGRARRQVQMDCVDYPETWISHAVLGNQHRSQCRCAADADCARGDACDPVLERCVPALCQIEDCDPGHYCDPFYSGCHEPPAGVAYLCETDADCLAQAGEGYLCNPGNGFCQVDDCAYADCQPGAVCSPFLHRCLECRHDCDCPGGLCDREREVCVTGCDASKLGLTPDNPQRYEYYVVCIPEAAADPTPELQAIDPTIQCNAEGAHPACRGLSATSCMGDLEFEHPSRRIPDAKWDQLCQLSQVPWVVRIVGGYWLD